jgi:hypothetical protein
MTQSTAGTGASASDSASATIGAWFGERLPAEWTGTSPSGPSVTVDREEITVVLEIPAPPSPEPGSPEADGPDAATVAAARAGRIARFREETRERRMAIAREAEHRFDRKVAWGVTSGGSTEMFTNLAIPVMTRLRQPERLVLDTLVDAGVARSRAHALAWCVRLVGDNTATWLADLRTAMAHVEKVRDAGPSSS